MSQYPRSRPAQDGPPEWPRAHRTASRFPDRLILKKVWKCKVWTEIIYPGARERALRGPDTLCRQRGHQRLRRSRTVPITRVTAGDDRLGGLTASKHPVACSGLGQGAVCTPMIYAEVGPAQEQAGERMAWLQHDRMTRVVLQRGVLKPATDSDERHSSMNGDSVSSRDSR